MNFTIDFNKYKWYSFVKKFLLNKNINIALMEEIYDVTKTVNILFLYFMVKETALMVAVLNCLRSFYAES